MIFNLSNSISHLLIALTYLASAFVSTFIKLESYPHHQNQMSYSLKITQEADSLPFNCCHKQM